MQGQRSSVSAALPGNLTFDLGSSSVPSGIDSQMSWNSIPASAENLVPDYKIASSDTSISYLQHVTHDGPNGEWSANQSSSSYTQNQGVQNEGQTENVIGIHHQATLTIEERQFEPSNVFSFDIHNANPNDNYTTDGLLHARGSNSEALLQDLNMSSGYRNNEDDDDDVEIIERPGPYISVGSSNGHRTSAGGSSDSLRLPSGFRECTMEESEYGSGSLDGRRASCKRKIFEVVGQSSGAGSSNCYQNVERSQLNTIQSAQLDARNNTMPAQIGNNLVINDGLEQSNSRLTIGVGEAVSVSPFSLNPSGTAENSLRNFGSRSNRSRRDPIPVNPSSGEVEFGNIDGSSFQNSSRLVFRNRLLDLNPSPVVENGSVHGQSALLQVPSVRRNLQSRWNEASSSRTNSPFASTPILGERDAGLYDETAQRNIPRSISDHPIFVPDREMRSSSRYPINWNFAGGNHNTAGNAAYTSQIATSSGLNSSSPNWSHRSGPQYPQRLSEVVRRSLLSSAGTESGGQSSNLATQTSSSATPQEMPLTFRPGSQGQRMSNQRSALLERRRDGAFGTPNSLRVFASAARSAIMSEIHRVLDLMRRGEGLRLEDMTILDNSIFFGMADLHDRHSDMQLDVDNMTYEELLALGERIGNVSTGLTEEVIINRLKHTNYETSRAESRVETEPCSICREEYSEGDNLGTLDCGHDFHKDCIKQWLMLKNLCPICKTTGLKK